MNPPFPIPDIEKLIQEGRLNRAQRIVEYGPLAIGKTWLATQFPAPVLLDTEDGSLHKTSNGSEHSTAMISSTHSGR